MVSDEESQNKEYHYLSLYIDPTAPAQEIKINGWVINGKSRDPISIAYEFKSRIKNLHEFIGLNERDMLYLVTPDRFVNGEKDNDIIEGLREQATNRDHGASRHG